MAKSFEVCRCVSCMRHAGAAASSAAARRSSFVDKLPSAENNVAENTPESLSRMESAMTSKAGGAAARVGRSTRQNGDWLQDVRNLSASKVVDPTIKRTSASHRIVRSIRTAAVQCASGGPTHAATLLAIISYYSTRAENIHQAEHTSGPWLPRTRPASWLMGHPSVGPSKRGVEHPGVAQDCSTHTRDDNPPRAAHELQSPRNKCCSPTEKTPPYTQPLS